MSTAAVESYVRTLTLPVARAYALRLGLHLGTPGSSCVPVPRGDWPQAVQRAMSNLFPISARDHACRSPRVELHQVGRPANPATLAQEAAAVAHRAAMHAQWHPGSSIVVAAPWQQQQDAIAEALGPHPGPVEVTGVHDIPVSDRLVISMSYAPGDPWHGENWEPALEAGARVCEHLDVFTRHMPHTPWPLPLASAGRLLAYAHAHAADVRAQDWGGPAESPFERQVLQLLLSWGLRVERQVLVCGYRIDLAVRREGGGFVLGIECDGHRWHSGATARARDQRRATELGSMGWVLHRVKGEDWFHERPLAEAELAQAITHVLPGHVLGARATM